MQSMRQKANLRWMLDMQGDATKCRKWLGQPRLPIFRWCVYPCIHRPRLYDRCTNISHPISQILLNVKILIDVITLEQSMSSSDTIFPHESRYQTHTFVPESPVVARSIISIDEENLQQMVKKLNRKLDRHYTAITREQRRILQSSPGSSRCLATMPPMYSTESKKWWNQVRKGVTICGRMALEILSLSNRHCHSILSPTFLYLRVCVSSFLLVVLLLLC